MSLLSAHFEQIAISCQGIDSLPFPPPKIFTNALLSNHDITSLIRDTEAHERALFSVPPPPPPATAQPKLQQQQEQDQPTNPKSRRQTVFNVASGEITTSAPTSSRATGPRRNTAVAAVLGGDLHEQIRRSERRKDDVDVEVLLRGAEKLCGVYSLPGAPGRIAAQRTKYAHSRSTLAYYEAKVEEQAEALRRMNKDHWMEDDDDDEEEDDEDMGMEIAGGGGEEIITEEEFRRTEAEVRELEKKKRELQERLRGMDKDLGGLLNM
ncbi:DASH complex subunit Spc34 [Xylaria arbuscula]|nr:DASH complex subunit Spc34 [Xylaria arbuscula]